MRIPLAIILSLTFAMAGCAGLYSEPATGMAHLPAMQAHAAGVLDDPIFLGMAAIEGDIDVDAFLEMAREEMEEEGEDAEILDKFEFRFDNGKFGDGRTGAWFGVFGEREREAILIVQSVAGGVRSHLIDFDEIEAEDVEMETEPEMLRMLTILDPMLQRRAEVEDRECIEDTTVPAGIDSDQAARIAMEQEEFRNHTIDVPEGDYIYVYIPQFIDCPWEDDTEAAMWGVGHVDIDELLHNQTEPEFAYVLMNATDGEVILAGVEVQTEFGFQQMTIQVQGGLLLPPLGPAAYGEETFRIPSNTLEMSFFIYDVNGEMEHWLTDPAGERVNLISDGPSHYVDLEDPDGGTWTIHSQFDHMPLEQRSAEAAVMYISEA